MRAAQLKLHSKIHNPKTIKCPDCPATYSEQKRLRRHQEQHLNLKYNCNICSAVFHTRKNLSKHICTLIFTQFIIRPLAALNESEYPMFLGTFLSQS